MLGGMTRIAPENIPCKSRQRGLASLNLWHKIMLESAGF